jgi:hypothetical protein
MIVIDSIAFHVTVGTLANVGHAPVFTGFRRVREQRFVGVEMQAAASTWMYERPGRRRVPDEEYQTKETYPDGL